MKGRVVVAMSGGVDSSTAAYLLKDQGREVIGISLDLYDFSDFTKNRAGTCCSLDDIYDARDVCYRLGIPHYVFNFRKIFEEEVISDFITEYGEGRTPNPCIICNNVIKFEALLDRARMLGADYLATGHYARITGDDMGEYTLLKGIDKEKDQSYFLYRLTEKNISSILFPCGSYRKEEVRKIAHQAGLSVTDKEESQEICFITEKSYKEFLMKRGLKEDEGEIVDVQGNIMGKHRGIFKYTVGQRKGINVGADEPYYVVHIDPFTHRLVVGPEKYLFSSGALVENISFIDGSFPHGEIRANAKVRYRTPEVPARAIIYGDVMKVLFQRNVKSVSPGQALVLYDGDRVLGGGVIKEAIRGDEIL